MQTIADGIGVAAVRGQIFGEGRHGLGVLALGGEQHPGLVDVDEQRDVVVAAPRGGLVDGDLGDARGVGPRPRLVHIVVQHAPQPGVMLADHLGHGLDRHGGDHGHEQCLEQQGEAAVGPCPRHVDLLDAALVAADARHAGVQVGLVLEEVEMAPAHPLGVVGRAVRGAAVRAGEAAAWCEVDLDVEPLCLGVEVAAGHRPGRGQAQRQLHQVRVAHCVPLRSASRPDRAWRRARLRQGRCAPRKRAVAYGHPSGQARGMALDRGCARRLGVVRPGRRNGPLQPNQETPSGGRGALARQGADVTTHAKQRGGLFRSSASCSR